MMVALLIASLVALMVMGVVRTTVRVVGESAPDDQRGTREDRVRAFLTTQFAWLDESGDLERTPPLLGGGHWVQLRTLVSVRAPHRREPAVVRLRVESDPSGTGGWRLLYSEETRHDAGARGWTQRRPQDEEPRPDNEDNAAMDPESAARDFEAAFRVRPTRELLRSCAWIEIAYLMRMAGGEWSWERDWVGRPGSPRAVRIVWSTMQEEVHEWVFPVVATY